MNRAQNIRWIVTEALINLSPQGQETVKEVAEMFMRTYYKWVLEKREEMKRDPNAHYNFSTEDFVKNLNKGLEITHDKLRQDYHRESRLTADNAILFSFKRISSFQMGLVTGGYYESSSGRIVVEIKDYVSPSLVEKYYGSPTLLAEIKNSLYNVLTHEYTHAVQSFLGIHASREKGKEITNPFPSGYSLIRKANLPIDNPLRHTSIEGLPPSGIHPRSQYLGRPHEIMAWANGLAKEYSIARKYSTQSLKGTVNSVSSTIKNSINYLGYGSHAHKLFLRYFMEASIREGVPKHEVQQFLGSIEGIRTSRSFVDSSYY